ncbi:MAG: endolytic transglycosylase MltG [Alphaproteobacteria bacterium]|nr:endolytic transglycosylase MltG [Alphaproteobacteria bacterium]
MALGFVVYGFTSLVILCALTGFWLLSTYKSPGPLSEPLLFDVADGASSGAIAHNLLGQGAFAHEYDIFVFKLAVRAKNVGGQLKAGEYELPARASIADILNMMADGKTFGRRVTVREGLTSFEIVRELKAIQELSGEVASIPPEGSLLPNTYEYRLNEERAAVLTRMEEDMHNAIVTLCGIEADISDFNMLMKEECGEAPLKTVRDVLTLASIVEKETGVAQERKRVAGVFINRLKQGIALQTDPTVIYAITKGKHKNDGKGPLGRRLLSKDLQIESPYNTYKYAGLPPGPIANPGRASIEAVLNPEVHEFLYFVADGTGGHVFSKTLSEHNENVTKWRKIRREQK